jgi:aryl-alcohol dehydrogenase-like predicted oxidoreductase
MLWLLMSTPGVTSVLNGMRTPNHVEDSLAILKWERITDTRPIYEAALTVPR